jgi:hypothetical protein
MSEPSDRAIVDLDVRGIAIAWLVLLAGSAAARADGIWCGTFGDERRPLGRPSLRAIPAGTVPRRVTARVIATAR